MRAQLLVGLRALLVLTLACGLLYPLAVTVIAQVAFGDKADGSLVSQDGEVVGSSLIGQSFTGTEYFHGRPSAAGAAAAGAEGADPDDLAQVSSGASNLGPTNPELLATVAERVDAYRQENDLDAGTPVPVDAVTASGSGLDPHISVANARLQAPRVAGERGLDLDEVLALVDRHTSGRSLGFLGEKGVNVLELNLDLDRAGRIMTGRGTLRVYLGAAPGVGKTFAMLNEGRRVRERGADLVVGFVECHGRPRTLEQLAGLEVIPRRRMEHRGAWFEEMDLDAVLARHPERVLVDELAHTNVPGSHNPKRWQDVEKLLAAGIDVISTVNIQHLESLNDVVTQITGVTQRETIPDAVVRAAEQVELVDQTPKALRRRMAHGNVYGPEKIDAALANYFRPGNLTALRELALLWLADKVDDALEDYRARHGISKPWETRERVVVALTGAPGREHLIRRAARIAQRAHGELIGVHVQRDDGLAGPANEHLDRARELVGEMGGSYRTITGTDIAAALAGFAESQNATQIVLGATSRSLWQELTQGSIINRVIRLSGPIDVHVISHDAPDGAGVPRAPRGRSLLAPLPPRRRLTAFLLAAVGLPLITVVLASLRDEVSLPSVLLIYLIAVLGIGAVGGVRSPR